MVLRLALLLFLLAITLALPARALLGADANGDEKGDEPGKSLEPDPPTASTQIGTRAKLLRGRPPNYPVRARDRGQEGWVVLSFSVSPDGNVVDPVVEDSSGVVEFERAAIKTVLKYRYSPATWNGKPVEQCAVNMRFNFSIGGFSRDFSPSFKNDFREVVDLYQAQRIVDAEAKLDEMASKGTLSGYEASKLWLLRSAVQAAGGDTAGQLRSLRRGASGGERYIPRKDYSEILRAILALEVEQTQYGAALATYRKLKILRPGEDPELDQAAQEVEQIIDGADVLAFPGVVEFRSGCEEGRPNWKHELLRRKFTFDDIEGVVDDFELRCDWKRVVDKVVTEKIWEVPDTWGWCQVFVFGEIGAKVRLIEYPLAESQRGIRREPVLSDLNN